LNDSKLLDADRREVLAERILNARIVGCGRCGRRNHRHINIYQASRVAMRMR